MFKNMFVSYSYTYVNRSCLIAYLLFKAYINIIITQIGAGIYGNLMYK